MNQQTFKLNVGDEEFNLTIPQLLECAQSMIMRGREQEELNRQSSDVEYKQFLSEFPDVTPDSIPPEVWKKADEEGSLVSAYRAFKLIQISEQLDALQKRLQNSENSIGSALSDGDRAAIDPFLKALMRAR